MASVRLPVPSAGLLRFLRFQSENLSFFNANRGPGQCLRRGMRKAPRPAAARHSSGAPLGTSYGLTENENAPLQACIFDLECLSSSRALRAPRNPRSGRQAALLPASLRARCSSTNESPTEYKLTWQERIFGSNARKNPSRLQPGDVPEHDSDVLNNSMFNNRRPLSGKAALEPELECTTIDETGRAPLVPQRIKKSELIQQFALQPRDLRKIDASNLPHILVRKDAILLNMLHLRGLISSNNVLLFDFVGSKPQVEFLSELQHKLGQKTADLPFEFRVLESVLQSITGMLEKDFNNIYNPVIKLLKELEHDVDREKLRRLLIYSKRVNTLERKSGLVRTAIWDLLNNDEDLAAMYLTEKTRGITREEDDHTEIEMLLESYHKFSDEMYQEASNLVSSISQTEEISRAILDANRNQLMVLDLKFNVGTLSFAMGTFIAGLYGMNLENFIEESHYGFGAITGASVVLSVVVAMMGMKKLRGLQRVKMGDDDRKNLYYHLERNGATTDDRRHQTAARLKKHWWWRFWSGRHR